MDVFYKIIALLGGLSMFLYGMRIMGDGLKQSSGGAMKAGLARVTNSPVMGFLFGMLVTCMIQSSTATIVLTVGLVGAGLLSFRQSVGIVLGANVGTAITAQIIRLMDVSAGTTSFLYFFKADNLAPMSLIAGIICIMFVKSRRAQNTGTILTGFGILFMGLIYMSSAVSQMGDALSGLLVAFEDNYILGFLSGVLVTGIIQSSSAVVGILQSLASSVGISFCGVFAVIIGVNIGDCLTTFLVSRIGAKPEQIRVATVHVIYNIFAALLIIVALTIGRLTGLINDEFWNATLNSGGVANVHGVFRLVPAVVLLPLSGTFANIAERIVPDKVEVDVESAEVDESLRDLDEHLVEQPSLALDRSGHSLKHMGLIAVRNCEMAMDLIFNFDSKKVDKIKKRESQLDRMCDEINKYLLAISPYIVLESNRHKQTFQMKASGSLERIGDHAENIVEDMIGFKDRGGIFSETAVNDLNVLKDAINDILHLAYDAFDANNIEMAREVEPMEEVIDSLVAAIKGRHIDRVTHKACDVYSGILFEDIVSNMERISDLCSDLGIFVLARSNPRILGHEHEYVHNLHHSNNQRYAKSFHDYYDRYLNRLGPNILEPVPVSPESGHKTASSPAKKSDKHVSAVTEEKAEGKRPEVKSSEGKRPEGKKSEGARPEVKKSECARPEGKKPEGARTEGKKPEANKSEGARPEGKKSEGARPEVKKTQGARPEGAKSEGKKTQGARPEGKKSEGARSEGKKPEVKKSEGTRTEGKKSEAKKSEGARPEGKKSEAKKSEVKKTEEVRPEGKKSEGARPEGKKTQGTRPEGKKRTEGKKEESSASVPVQNMDSE